jgi:hypothetical protein
MSYYHNAFPDRLPQDCEDMASKRWLFIQEEHAVVSERHFTRYQHVVPSDQIGDAVDECGLEDFGQRHGWQGGRHRFARPAGANEDAMCETPASTSALP